MSLQVYKDEPGVAHPPGGFLMSKTHRAVKLIHHKRNIRLSGIPVITRPAPTARCAHQSPFYRVCVTVIDLLNNRVPCSTIVIVASGLPKCPTLPPAFQHSAITRQGDQFPGDYSTSGLRLELSNDRPKLQ